MFSKAETNSRNNNIWTETRVCSSNLWQSSTFKWLIGIPSWQMLQFGYQDVDRRVCGSFPGTSDSHKMSIYFISAFWRGRAWRSNIIFSSWCQVKVPFLAHDPLTWQENLDTFSPGFGKDEGSSSLWSIQQPFKQKRRRHHASNILRGKERQWREICW